MSLIIGQLHTQSVNCYQTVVPTDLTKIRVGEKLKNMIYYHDSCIA